MKRFIRYNKIGEIVAFIKSNDETLDISDLIEIGKESSFKKLEKGYKSYKIINKKIKKG